MHLGFDENNEYGIRVSKHKCDTCGIEFTVVPGVDETSSAFDNCLADGCESYDPDRDAEILFMSDKEIAREKKIISMDKLRERKFLNNER